MARRTRLAPPECAYHVVNRGNDRRVIFRQDVDYTAFVELLEEGLRRSAVRAFGYCLMPNHFHLVLQPEEDHALSAFMQWMQCRYACDFRRRTATVGHGHVFQRRFWSAPLRSDRAFLTVLRYVEANALRAALVKRAEEWPWSSAGNRADSAFLSSLPVLLPVNWLDVVNAPLPDATLSRIRRTTIPARGRPLSGDEE